MKSFFSFVSSLFFLSFLFDDSKLPEFRIFKESLFIRSTSKSNHFLGIRSTNCNNISEHSLHCQFIPVFRKNQKERERWNIFYVDESYFCLINDKFPHLGLKATEEKGFIKLSVGYVNKALNNPCKNDSMLFSVESTENKASLIKSKLTNTFLSTDYPYLTSLDRPSSRLILETEAFYQDEIQYQANRLKPILYFHEEENFFPVSFEDLDINWEGVNLEDKAYELEYNFKAGTELSNDAVIYVNVSQDSNGYTFSYAFILAYNNCGPRLSFKFSISTWIYEYVSSETKATVCPLGLHEGDIEHVQVRTDREFNFLSAKYAFHNDSRTLFYHELEWEDSHPIVFIALGSHASYHKPGLVKYKDFLNKKVGANMPCPRVCETANGFWFPCFEQCFVGFETHVYIEDQTGNYENNKKFDPKVKIIKNNFYKLAYNLTENEAKMNAFKGRMGRKFFNKDWDEFKTSFMKSTKLIWHYCRWCKKIVNKLIKEFETAVASKGPEALGSKLWWA